MIDSLAEQILKQLADGKNVLITGPLHAGKTTLFNHVLIALTDYNMIQTKKVDDVVMAYYNGKSAQIGSRAGRAMQPDDNGLNFLTAAAEHFLASDNDLLAIDEIGYIEAKQSDYINLIVTAAQQKTLLAVLRQDRHALMGRMAQLEPYVLIELTGEYKNTRRE